jgi:type III secretory pathway lipoprotein EscJ
MRQIAIVPRRGLEVENEMFSCIACLRSAEINPRSWVAGKACAVIWVDDQNIWASVDLLRSNGFDAVYVTETDDSS